MDAPPKCPSLRGDFNTAEAWAHPKSLEEKEILIMAADPSTSFTSLSSQTPNVPFIGSTNERTRRFLSSGSLVPLNGARDIDSIKTKKGKNTHLKILETALECFAEFGPENTTVRRIAKKADISIGLVHHYFPKSENIFAKVMKHVSQGYLDYVKETPPDLRSQVKKRLEYFVNNPMSFRCYALSLPYTLLKGELRLLHSEMNQNFSENISKALKDVLISKEKNINEQKLSDFTTSLLESYTGALMNFYFGENTLSSDEFLEKHLQKMGQSVECFVAKC